MKTNTINNIMKVKHVWLAAIFFVVTFIFNNTACAQAPVSNFTITPITTFKPDTFCAGVLINFVDASTNSPTSWNWNFNSTNNANIVASPATSINQNQGVIFSNSSTAVQSITVTLQTSNPSGISMNTANMVIFIYPGAPTAIISASPTIICKDSSITFNSASSSGLISSWSWNFGFGTPALSSSSGPVIASFNVATTVTLTTSNACGSNQASYPVNIAPPPIANFTPSTSNPCNNVAVHFTDASYQNATSWYWDFGNGDTSHQHNPIDSFILPGTYTVTLIASNSCGPSAPFPLTITVQNCSPPIANFKTPPDTVCMNTAVQFTDSSKNEINCIRTWHFFPASTPFDTSSSATPTTYFNTQGPATIKLTLQNTNGISTITKTIYVRRCYPPVALFDSWGSICQGTCTNFTNHSTEPPYTSRWIFQGADSATSTRPNPNHICYQNVGTDSVTLIVTNRYGADTLVQMINVLPAPQIYSKDTCIYAGYSVELHAHGNGLITWSPTLGLSPTTGDTVLASPLNTITYTAHDTSTCASVDSITICLKYKNVYITAPNTFTPDGNGKNDLFTITSNIPVNEYSLKIYNRWGEMVFKTDDYLAGWDGTYRDVPQNSGVYVYIIGYRDLGDNQYKFINGNITLIR